MTPSPRIAGLSGILAGVGLAVEGTLWATSGWTVETFRDSATALAFLQDNGTHLRAAVFAGAANLVFATVFIVRLAARLGPTAPTRAAATLSFGIIAIAAHSLVPLGLWLGVPSFVDLAASDPDAAAAAWSGYAAFQAGAGAVGALFLGLSTLAAGWAIISHPGLPALLGGLGVLAGAASAVTVLASETPLAVLAAGAYLPSLTLLIVFRSWAGVELWKGGKRPASEPGRPGGQTTAPTVGG
jgi:Domain of unknown function (DUF4386)